ncbi:MAG: class I SAM-dependent methyltransferase, partial [Bacteroidota bacterium]
MIKSIIFPRGLKHSIKDALDAGFENIRQEKFFVTNDLQDLFLYSGKCRPEIYMDPSVRAGISSFHLSVYGDEVENGLAKLKQDID